MKATSNLSAFLATASPRAASLAQEVAEQKPSVLPIGKHEPVTSSVPPRCPSVRYSSSRAGADCTRYPFASILDQPFALQLVHLFT
ncbi:hypothetical protein LIA77_07808 [Sarocladium implicatum]|nr:hypothetical protein LIA77_07808 [Sarocladium implicatum]